MKAAPPHLQPFVLPIRPAVPERAGRLDIYRPAGEGPWPAILFVHGGPGPASPSLREWPVFRGYAAAAAERSVAGGVVEHSLVHGTALIGQAAAEVTAGADQLRATPGIDPDRMALWFFSGSGLLTARWLERAPSWLRCVAATYPRFSLPDDLPDLPTAIDAIARAPRPPVVLTRVGLERPTLAAAVEQFVGAAASSGANLEIIDVPHGRHGFDFLDHTDESRAAVRQALDRVAAHLTAPLHGAPTARISIAEVGVNHDDPSSSGRATGEGAPRGLDTTVPVSARIWNYWMGGKDYYQVDKLAGDEFAALFPGIRDMARVSRLFLGRAVSYLADEAGIRQFLDIGTGLPGNENTHEVAQRIAPGSRIVYVDNDPLVMAHAQELLTGVAQDTTGYIDADLNDPEKIISIARGKLDFTQPVAIMLMGVLGHIGDPGDSDDEFAASVVNHLKAALPAGGHLVLRDATNTAPSHIQALRIYEQTGAVPYRLRSPERIARFFDGLDAVEPGIVPVQQWRPDQRSSRFPADINMWGGVAVKR